ncbi:hypothetical protein EN781_00095 [Mesorhizobium sp. M4A.F.Ca.ET.090.04.2.1]|uniref:phage tail protein n=1 Tax=Mesorhizobium sp. M4A.F.Ca.ET.090.04.2.1 TaxID=2496663 RepID=UPI000FCBB961|nr:phage tail protein [Mesorhizobium sp. M4A.F.Ca.ET.090.04.2.1]RVC47572.1 hypothetical protein EN781_00095 [Mesorhizobium sp. M4A.F.Ca.ET.090.04.2.1]
MAYVLGARPTIHLGPTQQDNTKQPEDVSATPTFSVSKVLGRSIPIVIGTGKVDGIPVVGGAVTSQVISGYTQQQLTTLQNLGDFPPGTKWLNNDPFSRTVEVPQYGSQQAAMLGYLLAYDPFGDGYKLVRLEVNGDVVYDAENGIGASTAFRFDGGTQTAPDAITQTNIGTDAGAWQNFAIVYLSGYQADSAPTVKAVISNAATDGGGTHEIAWTGTTPVIYTENSAGRAAAYDPTQDVIYQLLGQNEIPGTPQIYLAVLDAQTYTERYRVPLQGSENYVDDAYWLMAIRGSGFVLARFASTSWPEVDIVYDVATGKIVSSHEESGEIFDWKIGFPFGEKYIITGFDFGAGSGLPYALIDILGNVTIGRVTGAGSGSLVYGRVSSGTVSFFIDASGSVKEATFDGDAWTTATVYTSAGVTTGSWYDPQTGYLVVFETVSGAYYVRYVDPNTGSVADSITVDRTYFITMGTLVTGRERYWPRPGYVMMTEGVDDDGKVYLLDVGAKTISIFASHTGITNLEFTSGIFDQNKSAYFEAFGDDHWVEHQLPNVKPGLVSLTSLLTKIMFLAGYGPSELTFDGLGGIAAYGFVIGSDTNVRTVLQSPSEIYGFTYADTGDGFYFKKPGQDTSFALDLALTTAELVFQDNDASVKSVDDAEIRSVSRVEVEYVSRDQGYESRPASFTMPATSNSIRVEKYSTPLVMSDADAQKFVTEKYFELQAKRRSHSFSLTGEVRLLPGDVVSVPSGTITYTVQVDTVALGRNIVADIACTEFQTSVSTTITPVTNQSLGNQLPVTLATQYIHLDVPLYRYADDLAGAGLRQYGILASRGQQGWGGGALYRGDVASALSLLLTQAPHKGVVGTCVIALGNPLDPFGTDDTSTVTIRRTAGDVALLVDATEDQVLAGANFAYIGAQGRWEAVGYKTVVANADGSYTLSGFSRRGYRGTEVFCDTHAIGDQFVMVDAAWLKSVNHPVSDLGLSKFYKAIGLTQDPSTGIVTQKQIIGAAETPYACVNLDAVAGSPDGIDISWDYRSRLTDGLNPANFGEAALSFEIDIYDGVTYKRTLTATANSVHYASADVISDLGSDPPAEITFDVFMMSALDILVPNQTRVGAGRGYRARGHIVLAPGSMTADNTHITADSTAFTADAA